MQTIDLDQETVLSRCCSAPNDQGEKTGRCPRCGDFAGFKPLEPETAEPEIYLSGFTVEEAKRAGFSVWAVYADCDGRFDLALKRQFPDSGDLRAQMSPAEARTVIDTLGWRNGGSL